MPTDERDGDEGYAGGASPQSMPEPQERWGQRRRVVSSNPPQQGPVGGREVLDIDPDELTEADLLAALNDALKANDAKPPRAPAGGAGQQRPANSIPAPSAVDHLSWADPPPAIKRLPSGRRREPSNPPLKGTSKPRPPLRVPTETRIQIATLEAKLGEAEGETEKAQKRLGQMSAETVSYRKRLEDRAEIARMQGQRDVLSVLVNVVDNFEAALTASAASTGDAATVLQGFQMVLRQMFNDLKAFGLTTFEVVGEPFDPNLHEALRNVSTGLVPPGHVAQQLRRGFVLNDRLFRAAMVAVESGGEPPSDA